jgi:hypothetical protein
MAERDRDYEAIVRFERFDTIDVALGSRCRCWAQQPGTPWVIHKAGCLCICHVGWRMNW